MDTSGPGGTKTTVLEHGDCVSEAAVDVFSTACELELRPADDEDLSSDGIIIGVISIIGDVDWSLFLELPRPTAIATMATFAGFDIPYDSEDMGDAVGELTNILAGDVKTKLEAKGVAVNISLPSVLRAEDLHVLAQTGMTVTKNCFDSGVGKLWTGVISSKANGLAA